MEGLLLKAREKELELVGEEVELLVLVLEKIDMQSVIGR